ncbi:MAG TPA: YfhO family protein, partial [Chitinophagaceae bacterium]|nr:YfhO family protein [Chitinophagaceae bacterium]
VISLIYSLPALQGKELKVHDTVSWMAMSQEARTWYEKTGENPMWTNSMFGGMPTYTTYMKGKNYVYSLQEIIVDFLPKPAFFFFIAMACFYLLMMSWRVNKWIAMTGAIAYAFAAYNLQIITVGHNTKMFSIAYLPLVLAGMHWLYRGRYLVGAGTSLLALSLLISNSMIQVDYYLIVFILPAFVLGYAIEAFREKKIKSFVISSALMLLAGILSVGPSLDQVLVSKEYAKLTMRGGQSELTLDKKEKKTNGGLDKDYAFRWSQAIGESFTLLVPNLYGGGSRTDVGTGSKTYEVMSQLAGEENAANFAKNAPSYWGPQPGLAGPNYFGAILVLLFVLGILVVRSPFKWVATALALLGLLLSWGDHFKGFNYFLFDHLPYYNNFRTPSMAMVITGLALAFLALMALQEWFSEQADTVKLIAALKKALIITGGLCLLLGPGSRFFFSFKGDNDQRLKQQLVQMFGNNEQAATQVFDALQEDRPSMAMKDGLRSLVFVLLAGGVLWLFARRKIKTTMALASVGILVAVDLLSLGTRYLNDDSYMEKEEFEAQFKPGPVDQQILQDKDPYYRVFDLSTDTYNDAMGAVHHKMVGGYHPAKLESYQDLIDHQLQTAAGKMNGEVLNMLNTKYIIFNGRDNTPAVQPNLNACGNAWFVKNVKLVDNADQEMLSLNAANIGDTARVPNAFEARTMAVVQKKYWKENINEFTPDSSSQIQLTKYGLNDLSFESKNSQAGFAVFSDIYYPLGWKAYVDGKEQEIIKTNYLLRGLMLPAGNHKIEFRFRPETYLKWNTLSMLSSVLILIIVAAGIGLGLKNEFVNKND